MPTGRAPAFIKHHETADDQRGEPGMKVAAVIKPLDNRLFIVVGNFI
jgi:hypothetical protein